MTDLFHHIISSIPYKEPFLYISEILSLDENHIKGTCQFPENAPYYEGHFKNMPIIPGVLLLETMGQIGLVSFGYYLLDLHIKKNTYYPLLSAVEADFRKKLLPGEKVIVVSEKISLRGYNLKCKIGLFSEKNELIANSIASCNFSTL